MNTEFLDCLLENNLKTRVRVTTHESSSLLSVQEREIREQRIVFPW